MNKSLRFLYLPVLSAILFFASIALSQTTKFTYQGDMTEGGLSANGSYEMSFGLFDSLSGGSQVGSTITVNPVTVSDGSFSVPLDFGAAAFPGADRYLEITVRNLSGGGAVVLAPRSQVASAPYAIRSLTVTGPLTGSDAAARLLVTNSQPGIANPGPGNLPPAAIKAESTSATAVTAGVIGIANKGLGVIGITSDDNTVGDSAIGVLGQATSPTGQTAGVVAVVDSPEGTAVEAQVAPGGSGSLFAGTSGGLPKFIVRSNGNVDIAGTLFVDGQTELRSTNVTGNLTVSGTKNNVVKSADGQSVLLYALEAPESWFEDFGTSRLRKGHVIVKIDKIFSEVTNTGVPYKVFLTPNGDCRGLYVSRKTAESFAVRELGGGKSDVSFDYRIVARRRGYESERFAAGPEARPKN